MGCNATETQLIEALEQLLDALDRQTFNGAPPGRYSYSANVSFAMVRARELLPPKPQPDPDPADDARSY